MPVIIGTRGSRLALAQTENVIRRLAALGIDARCEIIATQGDTTTQVPLHEIGGQGVFVRALDDAILDGRIDCAVHSMKDIPAYRPPGLVTAAILERDSPADFIAYHDSIASVRMLGTSSTRRRAQLLRHDPGLTIRDLRGNVDTRLRKLADKEYDAILLAEAGLQRLGLTIRGERLDPTRFVPSPNQGTVAVVARADLSLREMLAALDHSGTRADVMAERAVMEELGGGCFTPLGIFCRDGHLIAEVLSLDGKRTERIEAEIRTFDEARVQGRNLRARAQDLIDDAYERLGITHGG
jgi:hydroxymethylbilane synthase